MSKDLETLSNLIKDINIAMMTTVDETGGLRSRPMATQNSEFNGELWFFTKLKEGKALELSHNNHVNLSYSKPDSHRYVSITGHAEAVQDNAKIKELWNPLYKAWFPEGLEDPALGLLKVTVEKAEYWDSPGSAVVHLIGFAKAMLTGKPYSGGKHEKLDPPNLH